jgi:sulfatase maturation enzyme AslB (radical SAM superfamily)
MCITLTGSWRPCCRFNKFPFVDINQVNFKTYQESDFYKSIKTDMSVGWADGCKKCKDEENRGQTSLREVLNSNLSGGSDVEYVEISLSNNCNLVCKMCSPNYSTSWNKLVTDNVSLNEYYKTKIQPVINVEKMLSEIDLSKLKRIKYLGGEPFITPEIKDLFEFLETKGVIQNIEFECNTNCTLFPTKWLHYLDKFKKVIIEMSIDGVGIVNDYIRYGKTWNTIEKNIIKWSKTDYNVSIFSTVQAYNLHDMKNVKELANSLSLQHYGSLLVVPEFLSVHVLPEEYLENIKDEYNQKYYKSINSNNNFDQFVKFTNKMDDITGLHIKDVIPQLYTYME